MVSQRQVCVSGRTRLWVLAGEDKTCVVQGKVAVGMKLENELDLPDSKTYNLKNNIKAGIGRGSIKLGQGRKEQATGLNAEWQLTGGARENVQVAPSLVHRHFPPLFSLHALSTAAEYLPLTLSLPIQLSRGTSNTDKFCIFYSLTLLSGAVHPTSSVVLLLHNNRELFGRFVGSGSLFRHTKAQMWGRD